MLGAEAASKPLIKHAVRAYVLARKLLFRPDYLSATGR
jgi:hypothetical protein